MVTSAARDVEFPWEKTDKVEELKAAIAGE